MIAQQDNYRKSGFSFAHRNIRYCLEKNAIDFPLHANLRDAREISLPMILAYQKKFFPAERYAFATQWLLQNSGLVYIDGDIKGYGTI